MHSKTTMCVWEGIARGVHLKTAEGINDTSTMRSIDILSACRASHNNTHHFASLESAENRLSIATMNWEAVSVWKCEWVRTSNFWPRTVCFARENFYSSQYTLHSRVLEKHQEPVDSLFFLLKHASAIDICHHCAFLIGTVRAVTGQDDCKTCVRVKNNTETSHLNRRLLCTQLSHLSMATVSRREDKLWFQRTQRRTWAR